MSAAQRPLKGLSILVIDDDRLAAFRLHHALVASGARVASGDLETAEPYLGAAALALVIVGAGLNETDAKRLATLLAPCKAPWVAYGGDNAAALLPKPSAAVPAGRIDLLIAQAAALCAGARH